MAHGARVRRRPRACASDRIVNELCGGNAAVNQSQKFSDIVAMGARLPADDHPRVVVRTGKGREEVHPRAGERHHPRTRLAVAEPECDVRVGGDPGFDADSAVAAH